MAKFEVEGIGMQVGEKVLLTKWVTAAWTFFIGIIKMEGSHKSD